MTTDSAALTPGQQAHAFLTALFGTIDPGYHALLWTRQDKRSHWLPADDVDAITRQAGVLASHDHDVYVGVTVLAQLPPVDAHKMRAHNNNGAGLVGLIADVDIRNPDAHQKWNLPADLDEASDLLDRMMLKPSVLVHSGHGLQAWWLFHEFWAFDSDADRAAAASLAQRWSGTLKARAAQRGQTVDSVYDLARLFRVPGARNHKVPTNPVPVQLLYADGPRYNPADFEDYCLDPSALADQGLSPARGYVPDQINVSQASEPSLERVQALIDNLDRFGATWNRQRKDLPDDSPSSYDLSLASQAASAGWSDQEIAELLVAFRRRHKLDLNKVIARADYLPRTIAKAREGQQRDEAAEEAEEAEAVLDNARAADDPEALRDARRGVLDVIGAQLGLQVLHVWRFASDPPTFRLETPTHTVNLGGAEGVLKQDKLRQTVWETTGHQIDRFKANRWDDLTRLIPKAWEELDVGFEATERGEVHGWLTMYLEDKPAVDTVEDALEQGAAYRTADGRVRIFAPALRQYLNYKQHERVTAKSMGAKLRAYGCVPDVVRTMNETTKRPTTKQAWVLPSEWNEDPDTDAASTTVDA